MSGCAIPNPEIGLIPEELKHRPQWVVWREETVNGKKTKIPYRPRSPKQKASSTIPATWGTLAQALSVAKTNGFSGIGYVLSPQDEYTGVDWDKCLDSKTGQLKFCAQVLIDYLQSYAEVSPSGNGLHFLIKGKVPPGGNAKGIPCGGKVEMYSQARYFTMTGAHLPGTPTTIEPRQIELEVLHRGIFNNPQAQAPAPAPGPALELSDRELIDRAHLAANGDKFDRLMGGDWVGHPTQSEADLALCSILAFWTQDPAQIDRIFRQSGLVRGKWDRPQSGSTYGMKTIEKAIASTTETYQGSRPEPARTPATGKPGKPALKVVGPPGAPAQTPAPKPDFNLTDLGNAQRLVAQHGRDLRYCFPWRKWLVWDSQRWVRDDSGEVDRRAKAVVRGIYAEAGVIENEERRKAVGEHARKSESDSKRQAMINSALSELPILPEHLDRDPWLFNVLNGTLDLRSGKLQEHRRGDLISKLAPVGYDRNAECPGWGGFLQRITNKKLDLINFLQRATGYSLTGNTREQCLFFLYGLGANGKTTFLEVIKTLLGDYGHQTTSETFMAKKPGGNIPNDVAALRGARLAVAVEVEAGRRLSEVLIKELTGGDRVAARFLHQEWFNFKPEFKLWLAANHKPEIRGTDHAIWRRIRLIPFTVQIPEPEQDKDLAEKLKAELPGILNWAVAGCLQWQYGGLTPPQEVREATHSYRQEMDILADFLAERCIVAPEASAPASKLYAAYTTWAEETGDKKPLSQRAFGIILTERGLEGKRGTDGKIFRQGIGLKV